MPKIVQFLHPAQEAIPLNESDKCIPWNNNPTHRRKFLLSEGEYVNEQEKLEMDELTFWGEWEAQSEIISISKSDRHPPNYFNIPFVDPSVPERTHTTDPYVFGRNFKYFICRQRANANILKNLEPNSIIVFGSSINFKFCLDTVFIISNSKKKYNLNSIGQVLPISERGQFYFVSINPIYGDTNCNPQVEEEDNCRINQAEDFAYYEAVSFSERNIYNQMYSFVPCKTYNKAQSLNSTFIQPEIKLDFIQGAQTRGINSKECSIEEINAYWNEIVKQVEAQNLLKGTFFKTPKMRKSNGA